jgi:hypothetical protein
MTLLLAITLTLAVVIPAALHFANLIDRADRLKRAALTPVVPLLPVASVHVATCWRRNRINRR